MALTFVNNSSDRVDYGSDSSLDNVDPFTLLLWVRPTNFTSGRRFMTKTSGATFSWILSGTDGNLRLQRGRATTSADFITDDEALSLNTWNFVSAVFDTGAGAGEVINMYRGTLAAAASENSYGTSTDGSGAVADDASHPVLLANRNGTINRCVGGDYAVFGFVGRALTLNEVIDWQWRPRVVPDSLIFSWVGFNGTGTQHDYSGSGNNGTVTGATQAALHVPLGPPFAVDDEWQGIVAAAVGGGGRLMSSLVGSGGLAGHGGIAGPGGGLAA